MKFELEAFEQIASLVQTIFNIVPFTWLIFVTYSRNSIITRILGGSDSKTEETKPQPEFEQVNSAPSTPVV